VVHAVLWLRDLTYGTTPAPITSTASMSGDGGDVTIVEVDRLMESTTKSDGVPGEHILPRDLALLDLRNAALGDPHTLRDSLLGQPSTTANLSKPVPLYLGEEFLLACLNDVLAAGAFDMLSTNVLPACITGHDPPSSACRSFK
jgi:hypothetical protein